MCYNNVKWNRRQSICQPELSRHPTFMIWIYLDYQNDWGDFYSGHCGWVIWTFLQISFEWSALNRNIWAWKSQHQNAYKAIKRVIRIYNWRASFIQMGSVQGLKALHRKARQIHSGVLTTRSCCPVKRNLKSTNSPSPDFSQPPKCWRDS